MVFPITRTKMSACQEREIVEAIIAMRKKADEQDWIWEDIEELADQGYCRDLAANRGLGFRHFGI